MLEMSFLFSFSLVAAFVYTLPSIFIATVAHWLDAPSFIVVLVLLYASIAFICRCIVIFYLTSTMTREIK